MWGRESSKLFFSPRSISTTLSVKKPEIGGYQVFTLGIYWNILCPPGDIWCSPGCLLKYFMSTRGYQVFILVVYWNVLCPPRDIKCLPWAFIKTFYIHQGTSSIHPECLLLGDIEFSALVFKPMVVHSQWVIKFELCDHDFSLGKLYFYHGYVVNLDML